MKRFGTEGGLGEKEEVLNGMNRSGTEGRDLKPKKEVWNRMNRSGTERGGLKQKEEI